MNVLLVDDHKIYTTGLKNVLSEFKDEIVFYTASTIDEIFNVLSSNFISLILLDINLNGKNSIEYIDRFRSYGNPKIIVLTSYEGQNILSQAIDKKVDGFLTKTSDSKEIFFAIEQVLNGGRYIGSISDKLQTVHESLNDENIFTRRELEVLKLLSKGYTNSKIASELFISIHTVQSHRKNMFKKINIHSVNELIAYAFKSKLI